MLFVMVNDEWYPPEGSPQATTRPKLPALLQVTETEELLVQEPPSEMG